MKGAWESVITLETWAALEIHNSVPSLHLSSPLGPAPLGSFIFVLMAALDNGAAEKSQKVKTQLWHYRPSFSSSRVHQLTVVDICALICSHITWFARFLSFFLSSFFILFSLESWYPILKFIKCSETSACIELAFSLTSHRLWNYNVMTVTMMCASATHSTGKTL